jgi:hypothetical protein
MNYFVPLAQFSGLKPFVATLPFIYQFGGDLYTPDGMQTNINSEQTLEGIRLMSEFSRYIMCLNLLVISIIILDMVYYLLVLVIYQHIFY